MSSFLQCGKKEHVERKKIGGCKVLPTVGVYWEGAFGGWVEDLGEDPCSLAALLGGTQSRTQ